MPPPHIPTEETRLRVSGLIAVGAGQTAISTIIGVDEKTLRKHYSEEIANGRELLIAQIGGGVVARALAGDNACSFFFLKTQANWRETNRVELSGKDGAPIAITAVDPIEAAKVYQRLMQGG